LLLGGPLGGIGAAKKIVKAMCMRHADDVGWADIGQTAEGKAEKTARAAEGRMAQDRIALKATVRSKKPFVMRWHREIGHALPYDIWSSKRILNKAGHGGQV